MEINIIQKINAKASSLTEDSLQEWVLPQLMEHFSQRIRSLAGRVYGHGVNEVNRAAFVASARETLSNALTTFLFRSEHWKTGRDVGPYLQTCLKRLASQTYWTQVNAKRSSVLICPGCKVLGEKVFLIPENDRQRCRTCTSEIERLESEIKKAEGRPAEFAALQGRMILHKSFALHTRKGYRCPDCSKFIPESNNGKYAISCPYADCDFSGEIETLSLMAHPCFLTVKESISLDRPMTVSGMTNNMDPCGATFGDRFMSENVSAEFQISLNQNFKKELQTLNNVIDGQIAQVKRMNAKGTYMQKLLMYEAFKVMVEKYTTEMVSYLVHLKQSPDFKIQAKIFQEFLSLVEDALPFSIEKRGEEVEIMSIADPNLGLFLGKSQFDAEVQLNGLIPNNTIETYTGGRKYKMFGPCFLGKLIDVVDKRTNQSILNKVKGYSFVDIDVGLDIPIGTPVSVSHFRIPAHYEILSLTYLQRIRRNIVDKVYLRLHGEKRPINTPSEFKMLSA